MQRILSIGIKEFQPQMITGVTENCSGLNKPNNSGVLWGSSLIRVAGDRCYSSWKNFTECNMAERDSKYGISFKLHRNAKICEIDSPKDYLRVMERYKYQPYINSNYEIDFTKLAQDYDAFHLSLTAFYQMRMLMLANIFGYANEDVNEVIKQKYKDFYTYDAETWIIFNPDCINMGSIFYTNNISGGDYL